MSISAEFYFMCLMCLFVANALCLLSLLRGGGEDGEVGAELAEFGDAGKAEG
jgi:hypothetical protein